MYNDEKKYSAYPRTNGWPYWASVLNMVLTALVAVVVAIIVFRDIIMLIDTPVTRSVTANIATKGGISAQTITARSTVQVACPASIPLDSELTNTTIKLCNRTVSTAGNYFNYQGFRPYGQDAFEPSTPMRVAISGDLRDNFRIFRAKYGYAFELDGSVATLSGPAPPFLPGTNFLMYMARDGIATQRITVDLSYIGTLNAGTITTVSLSILSDPRWKKNITNAAEADSVEFIRRAQIIDYYLKSKAMSGRGCAVDKSIHRGFNASQIFHDYPRYTTNMKLPVKVGNTTTYEDSIQVKVDEILAAAVQTTQYLLKENERQNDKIAALESQLATQRTEFDLLKADLALVKLGLNAK